MPRFKGKIVKTALLAMMGIFFFASLAKAQDSIRSVQMNPVLPPLTWKGAR